MESQLLKLDLAVSYIDFLPGIITSFGGEGSTAGRRNKPSGRRNEPAGRKSEQSGSISKSAGRELNFTNRVIIYLKISRVWTNWSQKLG